MLSGRLIITTVSLWTMFMGAAHAAWTPPDSWSYGDGAIDAPNIVPLSQQDYATDPSWQMLGNSWGAADGVSWATSDNPGVFGHEVVRVGSTVTFKFDMYKTLYGTHTFDAIRAWIDWDHDKTFSLAGDLIYENKHDINPLVSPFPTPHTVPYSNLPDATLFGPFGGPSLYYDGQTYSFYKDVTFTETGYFDLLVRVTCSRDLGADNWPSVPSNWDLLTPWANGLSQGEVEKWTIQVVPIPPAFLLFGSGLLSMGFFRKHFRSGVETTV